MDIIAYCVVFLNLTNIYIVITGLTGFSFQYVGAGLMFVLLAYVLINWSVLYLLLRNQYVVWFLALFYIIPMLTMVYAPYKDFQYLAYSSNAILLFIVALILVYKNGRKSFSRWIFASWVICMISVFISYFSPDVFKFIVFEQAFATTGGLSIQDLDIAGNKNKRAFGLYMQSNRAAYAIVIHFLFVSATILHGRPLTRIFVSLISFSGLLLTGSRTGVVIMLIVLGALFLSEIVRGIRVKGRVRRGLVTPLQYAGVACAVGLGFFLASQFSKGNYNEKSQETAVSRVTNSILLNENNLLKDKSVDIRLYAQSVFIDRVMDSPLFGHGHYSQEFGKAIGSLPLSSHNMFLNLAYQYGILMMLFSYGWMFALCFCKESQIASDYFRINISVLVSIVFFVYSFANNSIFDIRIFPVFMAYLVGILFYSTHDYIRVLVNEENTLSKHMIA